MNGSSDFIFYQSDEQTKNKMCFVFFLAPLFVRGSPTTMKVIINGRHVGYCLEKWSTAGSLKIFKRFSPGM